MMLNGGAEGTTEKDCAVGIDVQQCVSAFSEVKGLDEPAAQSLRIANVSVELSKAFDLNQASRHAAARGHLMVCAFCHGQ
jgi:hypothetical protein